MKSVLILRKELQGYFTSPMFYLLAFVFTAFLSARFLPSIFTFAQKSSVPAAMGGGGNIHMSVFMVHLNLVYLVMLFLTPLITMKLFSEEKKEKTMDLLLTAPVSSTEIVLGKFLASWVVVSLLLLLALVYPLSIGLVASFDYGPLAGSYLGMFLMLGVNCAIGLFASSLTASGIMAAFLGVLMILGVMLAGSLSGSITHPFWSSLVEQLSMVLHIQDFFNGTIETSGVLFFVSTICIFCFLTQRVVESSRWR
ncbi:MAG: ABC transporter permease [Bdellovibrionales bacterium]